ncbi:hypothetical protein OZN62_08100 [Aurantiacibacter sp. MUD11]|uniref:hypothetical protein n=1 Tax=Aurantiacibacter sp. MUD11 TaxID=3003265 RepID=UPI0022AAB531|nr:hypothetical protein [Aurantiacibacter sp. MUD11]WAT16901.1 hypothetical protein OZN62_08100 [Aurantiacibacter sp. MUD11]
MKFKLLVTAALAFAAGVSVPAIEANAQFSFCSQPLAPSTYLTKPRTPFCATTRSCSQWEVDSYQRQVDDYFRALRRYANEVDDYYNDAQRYISCMADLD